MDLRFDFLQIDSCPNFPPVSNKEYVVPGGIFKVGAQRAAVLFSHTQNLDEDGR